MTKTSVTKSTLKSVGKSISTIDHSKYRVMYGIWAATIVGYLLMVIVLHTTKTVTMEFMESMRVAFDLFTFVGFFMWFTLLVFQKEHSLSRGWIHMTGLFGYLLMTYVGGMLGNGSYVSWMKGMFNPMR